MPLRKVHPLFRRLGISQIVVVLFAYFFKCAFSQAFRFFFLFGLPFQGLMWQVGEDGKAVGVVTRHELLESDDVAHDDDGAADAKKKQHH